MLPDNDSRRPDPEQPLHPCARCAAMQKTCCQRAEILVTEGDVARIARHTGATDFWHRRAPDDPAYSEPQPDDPNWVRYTIDVSSRRRVLRRRSNGDCVFLGERGCVLPTEVRPLVCRLYPYAYTEEGITGQDPDYCPVDRLVPKDDPHASMLTVLDMNRIDAERWRRTLYEELRTNQESRSPHESAHTRCTSH